jgi:hypothetical protein
MDIKLVKTHDQAIEFAKQEFLLRGLDWDDYKLLFVVEMTEEEIQRRKSKNKEYQWVLTFLMDLPSRFESRYLALHIYPFLDVCEVIAHC